MASLEKREYLYSNFRYRNGSYKARKMSLKPIAIMAKYQGNRLRLYGNPDDDAFKVAKGIFKGWRDIERDRRRLDADLVKQDKEMRQFAKRAWKAASRPGSQDTVLHL